MRQEGKALAQCPAHGTHEQWDAHFNDATLAAVAFT